MCQPMRVRTVRRGGPDLQHIGRSRRAEGESETIWRKLWAAIENRRTRDRLSRAPALETVDVLVFNPSRENQVTGARDSWAGGIVTSQFDPLRRLRSIHADAPQ
jgi:hypothetical protein